MHEVASAEAVQAIVTAVPLLTVSKLETPLAVIVTTGTVMVTGKDDKGPEPAGPVQVNVNVVVCDIGPDDTSPEFPDGTHAPFETAPTPWSIDAEVLLVHDQ